MTGLLPARGCVQAPSVHCGNREEPERKEAGVASTLGDVLGELRSLADVTGTGGRVYSEARSRRGQCPSLVSAGPHAWPLLPTYWLTRGSPFLSGAVFASVVRQASSGRQCPHRPKGCCTRKRSPWPRLRCERVPVSVVRARWMTPCSWGRERRPAGTAARGDRAERMRHSGLCEG